MLIPLRTSRPLKRQPIVTQGLIVANMLVYLIGLVGEAGGAFDRGAMIAFGHLGRTDFHVWQLLTYQFLHDPGSIWHLAFNMLFLWVFGSAVEDRLGRASFLGFYLVGGTVAGIAHMMFSPAPVIGASGAVAGVTGAFLALFPRSRIQVLLFFFIIGVYAIPAVWFVGFYFLIDVLRQTGEILGGSSARVAYMAHLAGYLYGFALAFTLLAVGIVKRGEFDIFFLFVQSRRRARHRAAIKSSTGGMWESSSADTSRQLQEKARHEARRSPQEIEQERSLFEARGEISRLIGSHELERAAERYRELLDEAPDAVMSESHQLDLANQFQADGDHERAAKAYELLLQRYPACPKAPEVRLILGLLYSRRLGKPQRARELIEQAKARLADAGQRALADQLLSELAT
jgi:membrane associated rhomboid family serine protease